MLYYSCGFLLMTAVISPKSALQLLDSKHIFDGVLPADYNRFQPPKNLLKYSNSDESSAVEFTTYPSSIISLSPKTMEMTIEMSVIARWKDIRLNETVLSKIKSEAVRIPKDISDQLWYPFFIFENCKGCGELVMTPGLNGLQYVEEFEQIYMTTKGTYTFICHFDLSYYPFDTQTCSIDLFIDKSQPISVAFVWSREMDDPIHVPPDYRLVDSSQISCRYSTTGAKIRSDNCVSYNFLFQRRYTRPVLLTFIPSMLIVFISWISFWFDIEMVPARVGLGLTSMLTLVTHFNSIQRDLPAVSTIMALDLWMFACIFSVSLSLFEFSIVNYIYRMSKAEPRNLSPTESQNNGSDKTDEEVFKKSKFSLHWSLTLPFNIDKLCRIGFPVTFFLFMLIFWGYYLG